MNVLQLNQSAGIFFYSTNTNRYLYLLRADSKNPVWSLPGGKIENDETLLDGIKRECIEEIGFYDTEWKLIPIQRFTNHTFVYHTFCCIISDEFIPELNEEHNGYAWVNFGFFPKPLHPGLFSTINLNTVQRKLEILMHGQKE